MIMPAKMPSVLKLFCESVMSTPRPCWAPSTSPTIAPMTAKPNATCSEAMIQVIADGMTTLRITCIRDAPRTRALLTRFPSTSRTPW